MDEHEKARWHAWAREALGWVLFGLFWLVVLLGMPKP